MSYATWAPVKWIWQQLKRNLPSINLITNYFASKGDFLNKLNRPIHIKSPCGSFIEWHYLKKPDCVFRKISLSDSKTFRIYPYTNDLDKPSTKNITALSPS